MNLPPPPSNPSALLLPPPPRCSAIPPSSSATTVPAENSAIEINTQLLSMSCDPFRHRLHAVEFRVPGHQQKESKVQNRSDFGQCRVDARWRFQAADSQGHE